jgi:hypothetical protein
MPRGYAIGPTMRRGDPWVRFYPTLDAGNHRLEGGASHPRLEMVGQAEEDMDGFHSWARGRAVSVCWM